MATTDPFKRFPQVDEANYLEVNVRALLNESYPALFNTVIEKLSHIRNVLLVAQKSGRLDQIAHRTYYMQALQWLNKQIALSTWVSVPQITDLQQLDESIASSFDQYTNNLITSLQGESPYNQIEVILAVHTALKNKPYEDIGRDATETFRNELAGVEAELNDRLISKETEVKGQIDAGLAAAQEQIADIRQSVLNTIQSEKDGAVSQLKQAQSLTDWGEAYDKQIIELEIELFGRKFRSGTLGQNLKNFVEVVRNTPHTERSRILDPLEIILRIIPLMYRNMTSLLRVFWSKAGSYRMQRAITFVILAAFAVSFSVVSILSLTGNSPFNFLNPTTDGVWYKKLTVYLPLAIILGLAYSYTVKNFRIYSNMLDQYKHRRLVAKTAQGIILSLPSDENSSVRNTMTAAAAQALFEHKVTGHLTKKEAESMSILELLNVNKVG